MVLAVERPLILDRYRPLESLGEGGFGSVDLAWDTKIQRRVAIKRIDLPRDHRGQTQLPPGLAEARTAAMLAHPNIVQVFDFDTDADEAFLIMEYVDGANLAEILTMRERLSLDEAAAVVDAVGDALSFAHENGVLHLDIKPENILVDDRGRVKVADFGLADLSSAMGYRAALAGTVGYMPPEQLRGEVLDEAADEWAFASTILEAITGENQFWAPTADKSLARTLAPAYSPPSSRRVELDRRADTVFEIALDPDPDRRFPSVTAFATEAKALFGDVAEGRRSLMAAVDILRGDDLVDDDEVRSSLGLWDRLDARALGAAGRLIAAVGAGYLAWLSAALITGGDASTLVTWSAVGLVALAAVIAPRIGSLLGWGGFTASLFFAGATIPGVIALVALLAWWWVDGRVSDGSSTISLAAAPASIAWIAPLIPLVSGFALAPRRALSTALSTGILTAMLAIVTRGTLGVSSLLAADQTAVATFPDRAIGALSDPAFYVIVIGWAVAALASSVLTARGSRTAAALGSLLGAVLLATGYTLAANDRLATSIAAPPWSTVASLIGSFVLILFVSYLGAPRRGEEE